MSFQREYLIRLDIVPMRRREKTHASSVVDLWTDVDMVMPLVAGTCNIAGSLSPCKSQTLVIACYARQTCGHWKLITSDSRPSFDKCVWSLRKVTLNDVLLQALAKKGLQRPKTRENYHNRDEVRPRKPRYNVRGPKKETAKSRKNEKKKKVASSQNTLEIKIFLEINSIWLKNTRLSS